MRQQELLQRIGPAGGLCGAATAEQKLLKVPLDVAYVGDAGDASMQQPGVPY